MATSLTSTGVRFSDNSVQLSPALTGFRNRIINGDMRIAQRGTSFAAAVNNTYLLDRYIYGKSNNSAVTITQNADVPAGSGLSNSLQADVTTADTSIVAGAYSIIVNRIEGYSVADLVGVPFTLSFWARSSKTGIHCVAFRNGERSRSYATEYTIINANTWEKKAITLQSGLDTSSGVWDFSSGLGLQVSWSMATGSTYQTATPNTWVNANVFSTPNQVNCLDTVGNIFAITGVQLEKGTVTTDFEFRPYSIEMALCQRYYETGSVHFCFSGPAASTDVKLVGYYKVNKRVTATVSFTAVFGTAAVGYSTVDQVSIFFSAGVNNNFAADYIASAEL